MNILLINHYAGSPKYGMEYRPYYLAREWVRMGHNVTIAAASFSHLRIQQPGVDGDWSEETIDGVRYVWLKTPAYEGNGVGRVFNMLAFNRQMRRHEAEVLDGVKPDAVIASSPHPLVIYPARRIAAKYEAKLVFEVRDLWPLSLVDVGGMSRWHPFVMWLQRVENYAYRRADKIVSVLPKVDDYLRERGFDAGKFACVPNGIDLDEIAASPESLPDAYASTIARLKAEGRFLVGYVGQHSLSNALDSLVESAAMLKSSNVALVLVGQGPEKSRLEAKAKERGADNAVFLPPVPKKVVPAILAQMDALFLGWNRIPLYRYGISPNKLMDYMLSGKPVIHAVDAGNDLVADSRCGVSCVPANPSAIAESIRWLATKCTAEERAAMGQRGTQYVVERLTYAALARQFLDRMDDAKQIVR
ncbi:MAG: glycosyltransferase family 4 protein [Thermoguttaceae bacterium]